MLRSKEVEMVISVHNHERFQSSLFTVNVERATSYALLDRDTGWEYPMSETSERPSSTTVFVTAYSAFQPSANGEEFSNIADVSILISLCHSTSCYQS